MGVVYEAFDRINRSAVALKALRPLDADAMLAFKREFRALAELEHDNVVRLGDLFQDRARHESAEQGAEHPPVSGVSRFHVAGWE